MITNECSHLIFKLYNLATLQHLKCDDSFYSCDKARGYEKCTCGADTHNKKAEETYNKILEELQKI